MESPKREFLTVRTTEEQHRLIKLMARAEQVSVSELVRRLLDVHAQASG